MSLLKVFVVKGEGNSLGNTEPSVKLGTEGIDAEIVIGSEKDILAELAKDDCEFVHIVNDGFIVLPDFYKALLLMIEETGYDYVCTHCESVMGDVAKVVEVGEEVNPSQFLVRQWVAKELGPPATIEEMFNRIIVEYKGNEFKGILGVAVG
jgi:hypothetical protein